VGRLVYSTQVSLDGFIADREGSFAFSEPDEEVHGYVNEALRPIRTHLYGRRLYEVMTWWETVPDDSSVPPVERDFGRYWRDADKVVYSRTLERVSSGRTRIERDFDPDAVRRLKQSAGTDLLVGGAELGAVALRAGLVDEVRLFVFPVLVGGGRSAFGEDVRARLELREERRFGGGVVHLRYDVSGS